MEEAELVIQSPLRKFTGELQNPGVHIHYREYDETYVLCALSISCIWTFCKQFPWDSIIPEVSILGTINPFQDCQFYIISRLDILSNTVKYYKRVEQMLCVSLPDVPYLTRTPLSQVLWVLASNGSYLTALLRLLAAVSAN